MLESLLTAVFLSKRIKASIFTVVQLLSIRYASGVSLMTEYRITSAVQARGRTVIMPLSLSVISSTLLPPIGSTLQYENLFLYGIFGNCGIMVSVSPLTPENSVSSFFRGGFSDNYLGLNMCRIAVKAEQNISDPVVGFIIFFP